MAFLPFLRLLNTIPRGQIFLLLSLMWLAGLSEGIGIILLVPLLALLQGEASIDNPVANTLAQSITALGLPLNLPTLLGLFLFLIVARNLIQYHRQMLAAKVHYRVVDTLRGTCFDALLHAEWRWVSAGRHSDHATLLLTDVNRVGNGLNQSLTLAATLVSLSIYLATAFILSWQMTLIALVCGTGVFLLLSSHRRRALSLGNDLSLANRKMHQVVQESLSGLKLTKILANEQRHLAMFQQAMADLRERQLHFQADNGRVRALYQTGGSLLLAFFLYIGLTPIANADGRAVDPGTGIQPAHSAILHRPATIPPNPPCDSRL